MSNNPLTKPDHQFENTETRLPLSVFETDRAIAAHKEKMRLAGRNAEMDNDYLEKLMTWRDYMKARQTEDFLEHTQDAMRRIMAGAI